MGCKPLDKLKKKHKKGLWSPDEDQKLRDYILNYGHGCWSSVPINAGLQRTGKSCRLRWINYLRPGLKRGAFSLEEEEIILSLHQILGNKWSQIAHHLPGRTDNEIKNHWHSYLKKRVSKAVETEAHGNNGSMNGQIQGSDLSQIPGNCSSESFDNMEVSLVNAGESVPPQIETSGGAQKSSFPKVLFAEWLCLDQFHAPNLSSGSASDFKYSLEDNISNSNDSLSHGLMFNEGAFAGEVHPKFNSIPEDNMIESSFKFADQVTESCLVDYFPGEFNMNFDYMYI